jgi:hypothetical protein
VPNGESEKLVEAVAERVRAALAEADQRAEEITDEATRRAEEIVAEAEARAKEIEADADARAAKTVALSEDQARERIERARKALDELGLALGPATDPGPAEPEAPSALPVPEDQEQGSDPEGRSEAPQSAGSDPLDPEPEPEPSRDKPSTEDLIAQLKGAEAASGSAGAGGGDETAARLVAMNMALDGASREDVEQRMADEFGLSERDALLDEVFERAGR